MGGWGGGPCDFSVSPSPFGLDFGPLDFGTSGLGLTIELRINDDPIMTSHYYDFVMYRFPGMCDKDTDTDTLHRR